MSRLSLSRQSVQIAAMRYRRMPIEVESPEETGYASIKCNLAESSMRDRVLGDLKLNVDLEQTILLYGDHRGHPGLRELLAAESGCAPSQVLLTPGAAGALFIVEHEPAERRGPSRGAAAELRDEHRDAARHRLRHLLR